MKYIELTAFGKPWEVCKTINGNDLAKPDPGYVTLEINAAPINPAELLIMEGKYATQPALPVKLGIEGVGTILELGDGVEDLNIGDRVLSLGRTNWAEKIQAPANTLIRVSKDADVNQLSMLKVNPATAMFMLEQFVDLKPGDWVIQNAANSAVGRCLIQLARAKGISTINVVRRSDLNEELIELGADLVFEDGEDLADRVRKEIGEANIPLGIDAVAGKATSNLAETLSEGGTVVNYGLLSGEPCQLTPDMIVFKGITLTGFWLAKKLGSMSLDEIQETYKNLASKIINGDLHVPVEAIYDLDHLEDALRHAYRGGRNGKILFAPNG